MSTEIHDQQELDRQNEEFWSELCGTSLARSIGVTERSGDSLRRFDAEYFRAYPYLEAYASAERVKGRSVLEIGPGFGSLGHLLVERGAEYHALDISSNPLSMMRYRLTQWGLSDAAAESRLKHGSALDLPHPDEFFDVVYSIGCLHHTGNTALAVAEIHRVLRPGGCAVVMLYHRHSFRQWLERGKGLLRKLGATIGRGPVKSLGELYDMDSTGRVAPHIEYLTRSDVRKMFRRFTSLSIDVQNFDNYSLNEGKRYLPRELFLNNIARVVGLDLYVVAHKRRVDFKTLATSP